MEIRQRLLRAQINPHFFFNVLGSIQNLVAQQASPLETNRAISRLAKLMRHTLESSFQEFVPLDEEVETLTSYLELQKLRFEKLFFSDHFPY